MSGRILSRLRSFPVIMVLAGSGLLAGLVAPLLLSGGNAGQTATPSAVVLTTAGSPPVTQTAPIQIHAPRQSITTVVKPKLAVRQWDRGDSTSVFSEASEAAEGSAPTAPDAQSQSTDTGGDSNASQPTSTDN